MLINLWNSFQAADFSTQVNIVLCVLSFILALFSLIFVFITIKQNLALLKQNNLMIEQANETLKQNIEMIKQNAETIENSTRPYITVYFDCTQFGTPVGYFVVRNYGFSSGTITKCQCNDSLKNFKTSLSDIESLLNGLNGINLAPNQKYLIPFYVKDFTDKKAIFDITYTGNEKTYFEHVEIIVENYAKYVKPRACNENNSEKDISYAAQEIAERLM